MELVLTKQDLEPLPIQGIDIEIEKPEGILNSRYQNIVKENFNNINPNSIFGIRQRIKSRQYKFTPSIDAILKLTIFIIVLAVVL